MADAHVTNLPAEATNSNPNAVGEEDEAQLQGDQEALKAIGEKLEARSKNHKKSAHFDTGLTISSLIFCLIIFVGADRISDYMFTPQFELEARERLARARADAATASLDRLNENINRWNQRLEQKRNAPTPEINRQPEPTPPLPAPEMPNSTTQNPVAAEHKEGSVFNSRTVRRLDDSIALRRQIIEVLREYALDLSTMLRDTEARDDASAKIEIAREEASAKIEIAQIEADGREQTADALRANEEEKTARVLAWTELGATGLTRVGALFLLVWLVRIFNANRQRNNQLAEFYQAVADYILLPGMKKIPTLKELRPPIPFGSSTSTSPGDDLIAILVEALRNRS